MHKTIIIIFFTVFCSHLSIANSKIENITSIGLIDKIPIFSKIYINKKDSSDFDSKQGKILILNFELKSKHEKEMKDFYKNYFKNTDWILLKKNENLIYFENKSKHTHKKFIIRRYLKTFWNLNFIVENF